MQAWRTVGRRCKCPRGGGKGRDVAAGMSIDTGRHCASETQAEGRVGGIESGPAYPRPHMVQSSKSPHCRCRGRDARTHHNRHRDGCTHHDDHRDGETRRSSLQDSTAGGAEDPPCETCTMLRQCRRRSAEQLQRFPHESDSQLEKKARKLYSRVVLPRASHTRTSDIQWRRACPPRCALPQEWGWHLAQVESCCPPNDCQSAQVGQGGERQLLRPCGVSHHWDRYLL